MHKIISIRSLLGYSLIISFCSLMIAVNLNIILVTQHPEYMLQHLSLHHQSFRTGLIKYIREIGTLLFPASVFVTMIFVCATVSATVESYAEHLAKLSLLGANRWQIFRIFFFSLMKPWSIAAVLGAIIGTWLSHYCAGAYIAIIGIRPELFIYPLYFFTVIYTACILIGIFILGVVISLRKFLSINALGITAGRHYDAARLSAFRIFAGIACFIVTVCFISMEVTKNDQEGNHNVLILGGLELLTLYLFIPLILKFIVPRIFLLIARIFPITSLLAQRYFSATIRRYASLAAPIMICLMFTITWFYATESQKTQDRALFLNHPVPITAVATQLSLQNGQLERYLSVNSPGKTIIATPIREDLRWLIPGVRDQLIDIFETNPLTVSKMMGARIKSGDLAAVQGVNIASSRPQDKVGDIVKLIAPSGKKISVHIVATVDASALLPAGLVVDYQSFPEAMTPYTFSYDAHREKSLYSVNLLSPYTVFYSGISVTELHNLGLSTETYTSWIERYIHRDFTQEELQHFILTSPVLLTCLALVMVNSVALSTHSRYIRKIMAILGGSHWQDVRNIFCELGVIFLLAIVLAPVPLIAEVNMFSDYEHLKNMHEIISEIIFQYPYQEVFCVLLVLMVGAFLPPLLKIIFVHRKNFS